MGSTEAQKKLVLLRYCGIKTIHVQEVLGGLVTALHLFEDNIQSGQFTSEEVERLSGLSLQITNRLKVYIECLRELAKRQGNQVTEQLDSKDIIHRLDILKTFASMLWELFDFHQQRAQLLASRPYLADRPLCEETDCMNRTLQDFNGKVLCFYETFVEHLILPLHQTTPLVGENSSASEEETHPQ